MRSKNSKAYAILYVAIGVVAAIPLACGYIPNRGDIAMWLARVDELIHALETGGFLLFPSAETVVAQGGQYNALDTNLWLFIPALLKMTTGNIVLTYRLCGICVQFGTLIFAACFFGKIFQNGQTALFATLFYMTAPYRLYLNYDRMNWGRSIGFLLLPLFAELVIVVYTETGRRKWVALLEGAFVWAGIAYADWVLVLILSAMTGLGMIWYRKWLGILPVLVGGMLYLPGARYVARYLIKGVMEQWSFPLGSIMPKGYSVGEFFSSFVYRDEHPGMGLGLLVTFIVLVGALFVTEDIRWDKKYNFPLFLVGLFMLAACHFFPWDLLQRVGMPFVRMVALWESPAIFFGCAMLPMSVLGAYGLELLPKEDDRTRTIKAIVAVACVGVAIYMCRAYWVSWVPFQ